MQSIRIDASSPSLHNIVLNAENPIRQRSFLTFQSKQIQDIANISKMQLLYWTQQGAILPLRDARGRGKVRLYNYQNLIEAMICRELTNLSIGIRVIMEWMEFIRENKIEFYFYFGLETNRIIKEASAVRRLIESWEAKVPNKHGLNILSLMKSDSPKKNKQLNEIIKNANEPEKTQLINWLDERAELIKNNPVDYESKKEDPPSITRIHNIWEFIRLYPVSLVQFFLAISLSEDNNLSASIFDIDNIDKIFKAKTSIIINLDRLIMEAGEVHG